MTNRYETVFILTPVLSEDQTKEAVKKFKDLIKAGSGKIHHEESWGMRKLAYPIQKKSTPGRALCGTPNSDAFSKSAPPTTGTDSSSSVTL